MKKIIILLVNLYKQLFFAQRLVPRCKYFPSCSDYMILAIEKNGVVPGLAKGLWRAIRCNPFSKGGLDLP